MKNLLIILVCFIATINGAQAATAATTAAITAANTSVIAISKSQQSEENHSVDGSIVAPATKTETAFGILALLLCLTILMFAVSFLRI